MPSIKYTGPHDSVEVEGLGLVKSGESIDCPADIATSLLEQPTNWTAGKKSTAITNSEGA